MALQVLEQVGYAPGITQTETVKLWLVGMFSVFPALLYLLSLITLFRFTFTREDLADAQAQLGRAV